MNHPTVQPNWQYTSVANVPIPAPKVQSVSAHYVTPGRFNKITLNKIVLVPVYLAEPYRTQLTKRFCFYNQVIGWNQIVSLTRC